MKVFAVLAMIIVFAGCAFAGTEMRNINGINISVQEEGEGQAVILIHGKDYSKEYMNSLYDYYKGKYHVFSYDMRGHGGTDKPESFTLEDLADDLAGLVESYGLDKPVVIGFSMGSYVALKAAEKYPSIFSKIVLIGTRGRGDTYPPERISEAKDKNEAAIIGSLIDFDLMTDIKKVTVPALVITGENDTVNPPEEGRKVAESLNAKFEVIPNAPHVAFLKEDGLKLVCSLIDGFLTTTTLTYSDHEPLGNMRTKFLNDVLFPAIERESGGRINIVPHWHAQISTGYDAANVVKEGEKAQLAVVVPEYCAKLLPLHQLFKSFPTGPTGQAQVNFFRKVYADVPVLTSELDAQNLHAIFIATGYPAAFFSAKPLSRLQDIKGQRWRSASFWHKDFLTNAGAEPVTMPWGPGVSEALNNGSLDGLIVNIDSGYDVKAHIPAPNIITSNKLWLGHEYIIAINKSLWESLADEDKKAIERAAESSYAVLGGIMDASFAEQIAILRSEGANIRIMQDSEVAYWEKATDFGNVQAKWISEQGLERAGEVLEAIKTCMGGFTKVSRAYDFLKDCGFYYMLTMNGEYPAGRPISHILEANGKMYFGTRTEKEFYRQLKAYPKVCLVIFNRGQWIRIYSDIEEIHDMAVREQYLSRIPMEIERFKTADNPLMAVFRMDVMKAELHGLNDVVEDITEEVK